MLDLSHLPKDEADALVKARRISVEGLWGDCYKICDEWLTKKPDDINWLTLMTYVLLGSGKTTVAYHTARRCTQICPKDYASWLNLGMAAKDLFRNEEAIRYSKRALRFAPDTAKQSMCLVNLAGALVNVGRFEEAEKASEKALELNPDSIKARANLGFSQLSQKKWTPGWENYGYVIGTEERKVVQYNDEPLWDGESEGVICLYGEQGLGDEISFASMTPDVIEWANNNNSEIILECEPRLENLFKRSFGCEVHGTRRSSVCDWDGSRIEYSIPSGQVGQWFRKSNSEFNGEPFLKPCPVRQAQWKHIFKEKGKPVIGIAWTGGLHKTGAEERTMTLEDMLPILKSVDAHWVSLQYKPAKKEIEALGHDIDIAEYSHATLTYDYDDTCALISALDHVVCMQTAVVHAAGGLGIPTWAFVPEGSQWRYGLDGEDFIWSKSVRLIRKKRKTRWDSIVNKTAEELNAHFAGIQGDESGATQKPEVRECGGAVRGDSERAGGGHGDKQPAGLRERKVNGAAGRAELPG